MMQAFPSSRYLPLLGLLLLLGGCSWLRLAPPPPAAADWLPPWQHWAFSGRIAVKTPEQGFSARIQWEQHPDRFSLSLYGPLGQTLVKLWQTPEQASIWTSEGGSQSADNLELLMLQRMGWYLPLSALPQALMGKPDFGQIQYDPATRLPRQLSWQGWLLDYQEYQEQTPYWLPRKLALSGQDLSIKLVISDWQALTPL